MGNKQVKLALRLDDKTFTAGSPVTGRVYLNVTKEQQAGGLHLSLVGEEYSQIVHEEHDSSSSGHRDFSSSTTHRETDRATASLVNMDVILTTFPSSKIAPGQYEFPFEWELPAHLPGTMYCAKGDSHCEIRYRIDAYLDQHTSFGQAPYSATQAVCVVAKSNPPRTSTAIVMDPEVVRIKSCCFDSGRVALGFDVDKTVVAPDDVVKIGFSGSNDSKVEIPTLRARLMETISWSAHGRTQEEKHVLTEAQISTDNWPQWHSNTRRHGAHQYQHVGIDGYGQSIVETQLLLPRTARDTYTGSILQVRHSLVITAVTPPCHTSVESGSLIRVQRSSFSTQIPTAPVMDPGIFHSMAESEPTLVEADLLPDDWRPQEAHVVTLPSASAVLLDTEYVPPVASAPPESLLQDSQSQMASGSLSDLLDFAGSSSNPVDAVTRHLNSNPALATTIQNLQPRDFVQVLQAANGNVPGLARLLAGAMGESFQCRHVLACVFGLEPQSVRMDVLREVAPLASDLDTQKNMVERELNEQELLYFRAALK